jgi:DNA-binding PadR family transcriptional regulator
MSSVQRLPNRYDHVLLGTLFERPSSGYDVLGLVRKREMDRWAHISTSSTYARLLSLERQGLIEGMPMRDGRRPERVVYTLTEQGRRALAREVLLHLTGFNDDPRTLGFAYLDALDPATALQALEEHERRLVEEIEAIEKHIADHALPTLYPGGPFLNCMSRDHMRVELHYVRAACDILRDPARASRIHGFFAVNDATIPIARDP